jgi:hypothetical protein
LTSIPVPRPRSKASVKNLALDTSFALVVLVRYNTPHAFALRSICAAEWTPCNPWLTTDLGYPSNSFDAPSLSDSSSTFSFFTTPEPSYQRLACSVPLPLDADTVHRILARSLLTKPFPQWPCCLALPSRPGPRLTIALVFDNIPSLHLAGRQSHTRSVLQHDDRIRSSSPVSMIGTRRAAL